MGTLKNELHNQLKGRIGDLVYYQLNGKNIVRSLPASFKDKKSTKQIVHRKRFKAAGELFRTFRAAIRFEPRKKNENQYHFFFKENWKHVSADLDSVTINYDQIVLCNHPQIKLPSLEITRVSNIVSFKWEADNLIDESFYVLCAVYYKGTQQISVNEVKRNSLFANVHLPYEGTEIFTYTFTYKR